MTKATSVQGRQVELFTPLRADASFSPDLIVTIGSGTIENIALQNLTLPFINNAIPSFSGGTVTFPSANGGNIVSSPGATLVLSCPSNQFVKVLVALDSSGNLVLNQGASNASEVSALIPSPVSGSLPICYISVHNVSGVIQAITQDHIFQFGGGGGSSSLPFLSWEDVTSTSQLMVSGGGYIADNATVVSLTLPAIAQIGDIVQVTGKGVGGWMIKSNAAVTQQSINFRTGSSSLSSNNTISLVQSVNQFDCVTLICTDASNGVWTVIAAIGSVISPSNWFGDGSDGDFVSTGGAGDTFSSSLDGDMVVKNFNNFTVNLGHLVTVSNRCRGLLIYVKGNAVINGTLENKKGANADPTVSGGSDSHAVPTGGLVIRRSKTGQTSSNADTDLMFGCGNAAVLSEMNQPALVANGQVFIITRDGAAGAGSVSTPASSVNDGIAGTSGSIGQSGGGGSGAGNTSAGSGNTTSGAGADGTCFSGGSGGGGVSGNPGDSASPGLPNGGSGGASFDSVASPSDGGAGNPGGTSSDGAAGADGTGGILILIVKGNLTIGVTGIVDADGSDGGSVGSPGITGGAGSGGGNIIVLYGNVLSNLGTIRANGGVGSGASGRVGGSGGAGSIQGPTKIDA